VSSLHVLGTASSAGKSLITTALARWFARAGIRVAPFKAQNMSNNTRVVAGGEIGSRSLRRTQPAVTDPHEPWRGPAHDAGRGVGSAPGRMQDRARSGQLSRARVRFG
jgi:CobQ/CobB/MinD/ParA family nucleotide binding protein